MAANENHLKYPILEFVKGYPIAYKDSKLFCVKWREDLWFKHYLKTNIIDSELNFYKILKIKKISSIPPWKAKEYGEGFLWFCLIKVSYELQIMSKISLDEVKKMLFTSITTYHDYWEEASPTGDIEDVKRDIINCNNIDEICSLPYILHKV